jgi:hypothetical protein
MNTKIVTNYYMDCEGYPYHGTSGSRKPRYWGGLVYQCKAFNPIPFICYTHERNLLELENLKTKYNLENLEIKIRELNNMKLHSQISKVIGGKFIPEIAGRGLEIMWGKFDLLERENNNIEKIYWTDIGLTHAGIFPWRFNSKFNKKEQHIPLPYPPIISFENLEQYDFSSIMNLALIEKINALTSKKILFLISLNPQISYDIFLQKEIVSFLKPYHFPIAGFFGGDSLILKEFINLFWEISNKVLEKEILTTEEAVMKICVDIFNEEKTLNTFFDCHYDHSSDITYNHFTQWEKDSNKLKPLYTVWQDLISL